MPTILASAARLAAQLQGIGHSMVVGFAPAWRWAMPPDTDIGNQTIRSLLSSSGIRTWDADLLQSLLMLYLSVSSKGNVNNYHHLTCVESKGLA